MHSFELRKYVECTREERIACASVVKEMVELAILAREKGVDALLETAEQHSNPFLRKGLLLVCDGTDPRLVSDILETCCVFSFKQGAALLKDCMMLEGILSIQAGENPRIIQEKQLAFLGDDVWDEVEKIVMG
jgi:flagellar motor component MotA